MYEKELLALKRAGRFRQPISADFKSVDMASNDYLGLAHKTKLLKLAFKKLSKYPYYAPKSSLFVNGYHPIHQEFETTLCKVNQFEAGVVAGSGFLANLGLIEALVRKRDVLFIDESYHASGMVATKLVQGKVVLFKHNNLDDLLKKLNYTNVTGRRIIAVEGIYSMEGDMVKREFFDISEEYEALMVVDEAHSSGTVGANLLGVYDHYNIKPNSLHIKMGTLGKAYGSYGAYILGSHKIVSFLHNRAKSLIYATAPSLFDIALASINFEYIMRKKKKLIKKINRLKDQIEANIKIYPEGMIVPIKMPDIKSTIKIQDFLKSQKFEVGAIRPPTVSKPILRIILRTSVKPKQYKKLLTHLQCLSR